MTEIHDPLDDESGEDRRVEHEPSSPMEAAEPWLLRRVAQAAEAGEVSADLLIELQDEIKAASERPRDKGYLAAVRDIAEKLNIPLVRAEHILTSLEAQPPVTRELMMRRIAQAWLDGQRKVYLGRLRYEE